MDARKHNEEKEKAATRKKAKRQNEIREGQENSSVLDDTQPGANHDYPYKKILEEQYKHHPEFLSIASSHTDEILEQERLAKLIEEQRALERQTGSQEK